MNNTNPPSFGIGTTSSTGIMNTTLYPSTIGIPGTTYLSNNTSGSQNPHTWTHPSNEISSIYNTRVVNYGKLYSQVTKKYSRIIDAGEYVTRIENNKPVPQILVKNPEYFNDGDCVIHIAPNRTKKFYRILIYNHPSMIPFFYLIPINNIEYIEGIAIQEKQFNEHK